MLRVEGEPNELAFVFECGDIKCMQILLARMRPEPQFLVYFYAVAMDLKPMSIEGVDSA
jgi:hypothetical protein